MRKILPGLLFFSLCGFGQAQSVLPSRTTVFSTNLKQDLVNYYPFNGNANDASGHNHHGTVNAAVLANDRFNKAQSSYYFGGSQNIQFSLDTKHWTAYTIMGWTFIDYGQGNIPNNRHILSIADSQDGVGLIQYPTSYTNGYEQGIYYDNVMSPTEYSTLQGCTAGASIGTSAWRHYALVADSNSRSYSCYLDGNFWAGFYSPTPFSLIQPGGKTGKVGCRSDNVYYFKGYVDDIRIYRRALSDCEINAFYGGPYKCRDTICENTPSVTFYAESDSATAFQWNISPPSAGTLNPLGDSCVVSWVPGWTGTAKIISRGQNVNGYGAPDSMYVVVVAKPAAPTISANNDTLKSSIATGNHWYLNNTPIPGATGQTYVATQSGWYCALVNPNGCASDSSNRIYFNFDVSGIRGYGIRDHFVYPNPTTGILHIQSPEPVAEIEIANIFGEKVYGAANNPCLTSPEIDLRNHPKGIYFYRVTTDDGKQSSGKVIIE